jgi:hypothetical protein
MAGYCVAIKLEEAESKRYHIPRGPYMKSKDDHFEEHLNDDETGEELPWLNEDA